MARPKKTEPSLPKVERIEVSKYLAGSRPNYAHYTASPLQKANQKLQWLTNFCMHPLPLHMLASFPASRNSTKLIDTYNSLQLEIKASLRNDYLAYKAHIQEKDSNT